MARPLKEGLDYFPLDTNFDQNDKIAILESIHGTIAVALVIKIIAKIYDSGYFYKWEEKEEILFKRKIFKSDINLGDFIYDCMKFEIFNEFLFKKYSILTSMEIQKRYFEALKRRKRINVIQEYLLLDAETVNDFMNLSITSINVNNNVDIEGVNVDIITQSKLNNNKRKTKVKGSKVSNIKTNEINDITTSSNSDNFNPEYLSNNNIDKDKNHVFIEKIKHHYLESIKNSKHVPKEDLILIKSAYNKYQNLDFIINTMNKAIKDNIVRKGKCTINSFNYFVPILEDNWGEVKIIKEDAANERADRKRDLESIKGQFVINSKEG